MDRILYENKTEAFEVSDQFSSCMLLPIIKNLEDKAATYWDDYDEVYHCMKLIEEVENREDITMHFHTFIKDGKCLGIMLISEGAICGTPFFRPELHKDPEEKAVVLNYFHISKEGRGNGSRWVKDILIPDLKKMGFHRIYVKSSHPRAFSFYARLGEEIGQYTTVSDTGKFVREGRIYSIDIL